MYKDMASMTAKQSAVRRVSRTQNQDREDGLVFTAFSEIGDLIVGEVSHPVYLSEQVRFITHGMRFQRVSGYCSLQNLCSIPIFFFSFPFSIFSTIFKFFCTLPNLKKTKSSLTLLKPTNSTAQRLCAIAKNPNPAFQV